MRTLTQVLAAAVISLVCVSANAQFGFKLPFGGNTPVNTNDLTNHLTKLAKGIDEPQEIEIGQNFAATLLGAKPMLANDHLQRYVNALGHYLALQTERPDLPWTFAVLEDPGFNAFATPGGYIFVTRGLVERMHSESELAGVLAHEIGHVLRKHYLKAIQTGAIADVVSDLAGPKVGNNPIKAKLVDFAKNLYAKGLDKEDEFEADRIGVVIAARAGYDPFGLPAVIQILQEQSATDNNFSLLLKTHPPPADRLDRLDRLMKNQFDTLAGSVGAPIANRLKEY